MPLPGIEPGGSAKEFAHAMNRNRTAAVPLDSIARTLATSKDRRTILRAIGLGLAGAFAGRRMTAAQDRDGGPIVSSDPLPVDLCSPDPCDEWTVCFNGECLYAADVPRICGADLCPAGSVCVCNEPPPDFKGNPDDLCGCICPKDKVEVNGICQCQRGTGCSGIAAAGRQFGPDLLHDREYTTEGMCCSYPRVAFACSNSGPGLTDGFAVCCVPGVDCPFGYDGMPDSFSKIPKDHVCAVISALPCCDYRCGDPGYGAAAATDY
jgi:hypothetical protein